MSKSTTSLIFPDINVWLALTVSGHVHFPRAWQWYRSLSDDEILCFCRITQLGLLRLLTTNSVMGKSTHCQAEAWQVYDRWLDEESARFLDEPPTLETAFRTSTLDTQTSPKHWTDAYLAAFAETAGLTLVTFDKALAAKAKGALLLG